MNQTQDWRSLGEFEFKSVLITYICNNLFIIEKYRYPNIFWMAIIKLHDKWIIMHF